jgi:DNA-binding transcriptional LysR family regulator
MGRLIIGVDAADAAIAFARSGRGLVYTFENWLLPHFATGALKPILPEWRVRFEGPRLYFSRRFMPAPLRAFVDFVSAESTGSEGSGRRSHAASITIETSEQHS